jgi:hypothetical protein
MWTGKHTIYYFDTAGNNLGQKTMVGSAMTLPILKAFWGNFSF